MATLAHNNQSNIGVSLSGLSPSDQDKIKNAVKELDASMTRVAGERELQKEIVKKVFEEIAFPKHMLKKLAKTYFNSDFDATVQEFKDFEDFYVGIMKKTTP